MPRRLVRLRSLVDELKRRKVVRTVVAYVLAAGALIGVASDVVPALYLPGAVVTLIVVIAILGLPVVVALSWYYDVSPDAGAPAAVAGPVASPRKAAGARAEPRIEAGRADLPPTSTAFIGRARELADLGELLAQPTGRLVTIIGPGGAGKTRLALRFSELAAPSYRHGVVRVGLSSLTDPRLLPLALLDALGLTASRRDEPLEEVLDFLRGKELLLVLDNVEHLIEGADVLNAILDAAPGVRLLTTSRERLNLRAESLLVLGGLATRADGGGDGDAVQLFRTTARRIERNFERAPESARQVQEICELLGGLPLAIELAASWVRVMNCGEILQELQRGIGLLTDDSADLPVRQRSLRATFDASWNLLTPAERTTAARLGVFRSPFDRHAALAVADASPAALRSLLDKSLLKREPDGFTMLNVVRQYARERLQEDATDEADTLRRHVDWHAALLRRHVAGIIRSDDAAVREVARSIDEVRAAWQHAVATGDREHIGAMLDPLYHFYEARGWAREGVDAFRRALSRLGADATSSVPAPDPADGLPARPAAPAGGDDALLGRLQVRCGALHARLGETEQAHRLLATGVAAAAGSGNELEHVFALQKRGAALLATGGVDAAAAVQRQALALARDTRDRHALGWSLMHSGNVLQASGDYAGAEALYTEALQVLKDDGDAGGAHSALNNLGVIAASRQEYEQARRRFSEALELPGAQQNRRSAAMLLHNLGSVCREMGDLGQAEQYLRQAVSISEEMGYRNIAVLAHAGLAELMLARDEVDAAAHALDHALRTALAACNQRLVLQGLGIAAHLRLRTGDPLAATDLARVVAAHPASGEDMHRYAMRLLEQLGAATGDAVAAANTDLNALARQFVSESKAAPALPAAVQQ